MLVVHLSLLSERTGNHAVTCVRGHAGAIDGRNPVVVAGNSAGGTLSAVVAQKARKHGGAAAQALAAQVTFLPRCTSGSVSCHKQQAKQHCTCMCQPLQSALSI